MENKEQELVEKMCSVVEQFSVFDVRQDRARITEDGINVLIALVREHDGWVSVPKELTAENGAKFLLNGEFFAEYEVTDNDGDSYEEKVVISWATIKEIYAMAVGHFAPPTTEKE